MELVIKQFILFDIDAAVEKPENNDKLNDNSYINDTETTYKWSCRGKQ